MEVAMNYRKIILLILFVIGYAKGPCQAGDSVAVFVKGYVFDMNGNPINKATILLQRSGVLATTDSLGTCTIYRQIPVNLPVKYMPLQPLVSRRPVLKSDALVFSVPGSLQQVTISLFSFSGRKITDIVRANLAPGNYRINHILPSKSSQPYILRAQIGDQVTTFKVAMQGVCLVTGSPSVATVDRNPTSAGLSKNAVLLDNIVASATNYAPETRPLDSTDGAHYFYLRPAGSTAGKHLDITFTFTDLQDPYPSFQTTVWLEDSNKVRLRTMFVCQWLSVEGYRRTGICPDWLGPDSTFWANERMTNRPAVDAVTHATPILGKNSINAIVSGVQNRVRCCIETHVDGTTNIMYSAPMDLNLDSLETGGTVTYVPSRTVPVDALSEVAFRLHK